MARFSASSPYAQTQIIDDQYLDIITIRPVPKNPDDVEYTIESQYNHRPDLLAKVSGLSRRQRSLPAVHHYFCCRAVAIRPRESLLVPVTLYYLIKLGGESEIIRFGVSIDALF